MQRRIFHALLISLASFVQAHPTAPSCRELQIPVPVSVPRYIIDISIEDDWDATALTFNLTRRDAGQATFPLPILGTSPDPVASTFTVGATFCGNSSTVLVLTHGIIESSLYWHPNFKGGKRYSFVDAAVAAGYSVLSYDRIGVASSSKVDGLQDAQFQVETAVLDYLTAYVRQNMAATKVALVGHSYGAYLSAASANHTAVDAVVLSGFSGSFKYFPPFVAGADLHVARLLDPKRWGSLDSTYLMTADLYSETYGYFKEPLFKHEVAKWSHEAASEPFGVGELISLLADYNNFNNVTAPVLLLQGQFDVSACGGNCVDFLEEGGLRKDVFESAKSIQLVNDLPAGHNLNLHEVAPHAFELVFEFLKSQGV